MRVGRLFWLLAVTSCAAVFVLGASLSLFFPDVLPTPASAGSLQPTGAPGSAASALYTLEDIYNVLKYDATVEKRTGPFQEPTTGPASAVHTTDDIMKLIKGVFKVSKTGQTTSYTPGDDGDLEVGGTWPNPRFTDNGDGTVTDNMTTLIWLKNASCLCGRLWADAVATARSLAAPACGLSDGSTAGQWRMPNVKELYSLVDVGRANPSLPSSHPFSDDLSAAFWSSSTSPGDAGWAWNVGFSSGFVNLNLKTNIDCVWPVRGGQ